MATTLSVVVLPVAPAQAAPGDPGPAITLAKEGPGTVLVGEPARFRLRVNNPAASTDPAYNVSFRDVLPPGVTYQAGSVLPASAGAPTAVPNAPSAGYTTLVWRNVTDVQPAGSAELSYQVVAAPASYPVGATFTNSATVYANSDPRTVPAFNAAGVATAGTFTASAGPRDVTTTVGAIRVRKSEPSPEHELVRGVHFDTTVYTLTVTNNGVNPTTGVTVVDYLPAGLEFLGCGGDDNGPDGLVEYPGAPRLTAVPVVGANCPTPAEVETVLLAAGGAGTGSPAGVYTKVTWSGISLPAAPAAGSTVEIRYRAGIPMRANELAFPSFPVGEPTPGSGDQAANLDNNSGASTRETASELSLRNYVRASGQYQGPGAGGQPAPVPVTDYDSLGVTAEDLALQKTVSPTTWSTGSLATYELTLRTGEYATASGITVTDVIPDGMCPVWGIQTPTVTGPGTIPATCGAGQGADPTNATLQSVAANADGTFTLTFAPLTIPTASSQLVVTYQARMRASYGSTAPPVAGDGFTNDARLTGTTTTIPAVATPVPGYTPIEQGTQTVTDDSEATITSSGPSIDKRIGNDRSVTDCALATYVDTPDPATAPLYREGDRVCFQLTVDFPGTIQTKKPVVTDFLPPGVAYESGSTTVVAPPNDVAATLDATGAPATGGGALVWTIGTGSPAFVPIDATFQVRFAGIVVTDSSGTIPDITGNLMKFRSEDTGGQAVSLRDQVDFRIAPAPPMTITKSASETPPEAGQAVTYTVTPTNAGSVANGNAEPVSNVQVWDVLPTAAPGITCANVSAISTPAGGVAGTCDGATNTVKWTVPGPVAAGASAGALTYVVTFPLTVAAGSAYTNTAGVRSYTTSPNIGGTTTHYPTNNIDPNACGTSPAPDCDVPEARASRTVTVPRASVAKSGTTSVTYPIPYANPPGGNNTPSEATIGEIVTYTVDLTIPAKTNVYNGVLTDPLPPGLEYVATPATTVTRSTNGTDGPFADYTSTGQATVTTTASSVTVTLPTSYTDASASTTSHVIRLVFSARVTTSVDNVQGVALSNTATLTSKRSVDGANLPARSSTPYGVTVVEPDPTLAKDRTPTGLVAGGDVLTFTLTASNPSGRAPLEDALVVDCVPAGLVFQTYGTPSQGTTTPAVDGDGANGCPTTTKKLVWNVGTLAGGTPATLTYTAQVSSAAVGGDVYTNNATLTGGTLNDGTTTPNPNERTYSKPASSSATVRGGLITKAVKAGTTTTPTVGERVTYVVTATVPADVNLYQAALIDTLPRGLDVSTLQLEASSCSTGCSFTTTVLSPSDAGGGATKVGWLLGDFAAAATQRVITLEYSAKVADLAGPFPVAGTSLTNSVVGSWDLTQKDDPTSAGATFDKSTLPATTTVTVYEPRVTVAKAVDDTTPQPGQSFGYTVTVSASGGANRSAAFNVTVVDTVPVGVVVNAASISDSGVYDAGARTITWQLAGPIDPGTSRQLTYSAALAPSASLTPGAGLTNSVGVTRYTSLTCDPPAAGCGARVYDDVTPATATVRPDLPVLGISKAAQAPPVAYVGTPFTWTVTVTNTGTADATGVDVVDLLPPNWVYVTGSTTVTIGATVTTPAPSVTGAAQKTLTWNNIGDLAPAGVATVVFQAQPTSAALTDPGVGSGVAHTNTAWSTWSDGGGYTRDDYRTSNTTATARIHAADLSLDKSYTVVQPTPPITPPLAADQAVPGSTIDWVIEVSNLGPDASVGPIVVTDTLPAGVEYVSGTGTDWACVQQADPQEIRCQTTRTAAAPPPASALPDLTIRVRIPADTPTGTSLLNTATVTGTTYDPVPGNNTDTDTVVTRALADLRIVKTQPGDYVVGGQVTYTLEVTNLGPSNSIAPVTVVDTLPTGVSIASIDDGGDWSCTPTSGPATTLTCQALATIPAPPGTQPEPILVTVDVLAPPTGDTAVNTATVTPTTEDPYLDNNTSTVTDPVVDGVDLQLTKSTTGSDPARAGGTTQFTITVDNAGPAAALDLSVVDALDVGLLATDASGPGWTCDVGTGVQVTCTRPSLAAGASSGIVITAQVRSDVPDGTTLANTATVTTTSPDTGERPDTDDSTVAVVARADLKATKSHTSSTDPVVPGSTVTFQVGVRNLGPSDAVAPIRVVDTLPPGLSLASTSGPWDCVPAAATAAGQQVTCTLAGGLGLAAGATAPALVVTAVVRADGTTSDYTNVATVSTPTVETDYDNNTASDPVSVKQRADVLIVKSHSGAAQVGETVDFTLAVSNNGPSTASSVSVRDELPAGLSYVSAVGDGWACSVAGRTVTCALGAPLAPGAAAAPIRLRVRVEAAAVPQVVNTAVVSTTTPDPNPDNDSSSDTLQPTRGEQEPTRPVTIDRRPGKVVIDGGTTNAGQRVRVRAACLPARAGLLPTGDVRYCTVKRTKSGKVVVRTNGPFPVRVRVVLTAPGTDAYEPYREVRIVVIRRPR